jgi:heat shock protein HtpX
LRQWLVYLLGQAPRAGELRGFVVAMPQLNGGLDLTIGTTGDGQPVAWDDVVRTFLPCDWDVRVLDTTQFGAHCADMPDRGQLNLAPLTQILHAAGYRTVELTVIVTMPPKRSEAPSGWSVEKQFDVATYHARSSSFTDLPLPLPLRRPAPATRATEEQEEQAPPRDPSVPLAVVLLAPMLAALVMRATMPRDRPSPVVVWLAWIETGTWVLWLLVLPASQVVAIFRNGPGNGTVGFLASVALFAIPPLIGYTGAFLILGGKRGLQGLEGMLFVSAGRSLLFNTANICMAESLRGRNVSMGAMTLAILAALGMFVLATKLMRRKLVRVEAGELHDRIQQLATEAKIGLAGIYLIRKLPRHQTNAYAWRRGRAILAADHLLREFPKREVDALLAHELGHLVGWAAQPPKVYEAYAVAMLVSAPLQTLVPAPSGYWEPALLVATIAGLFITMAMTRNREFAADARSAEITKDPCAMMAALGRAARMWPSPLAWNALEGAILTHPTFRDRVRRLAARHQIWEKRALEIVENPDSLYGPEGGERSPALSARYDAAAPYPGGDPCFSLGAKSAHLAGVLWLTRVSLVAQWMAAAYAAAALTDSHLLQICALGAAVFPILLSTFRLIRWKNQRFLNRAAQQIAPKLPVESEGEFVGLWPTDNAAPVDGFFAWDMGRIWFTGDHLVYAGERARFAIPRSEFLSVRVEDTPGTRGRMSTVILHSSRGALAVRPIAGWSSEKAHALHERWMAAKSAPPGALPPEVVPVYPEASVMPATAAAPSGWVTAHVAQAGMILLLGLGLRELLPENPLSMLAAVCAAVLYLGMVLRSSGSASSVRRTNAGRAGTGKLDRLKEEEAIVVEAARLIKDGQNATDWAVADGLYVKACQKCEQLLQASPRHLLGLQVWARALALRAVRKNAAEADGLYAQSEEKLVLALSVVPGDADRMADLAHVRLLRAVLGVSGRSDELLVDARTQSESALRIRPSFAHARILWAHVLAEQSKRDPAEKTDQALAEGLASFEAAPRQVDDAAKIARGQAAILFAQGIRRPGEEAASMLRQAKAKFLESESCEPGTGAYRAACVCARLGETDECFEWLEKSREPEILVTADEMEREAHLESVRGDERWGLVVRRDARLAVKAGCSGGGETKGVLGSIGTG